MFDGGYTALIDVVVKDQQIQLVEFDERGPKTIILKNGQEWQNVYPAMQIFKRTTPELINR